MYEKRPDTQEGKAHFQGVVLGEGEKKEIFARSQNALPSKLKPVKRQKGGEKKRYHNFTGV